MVIVPRRFKVNPSAGKVALPGFGLIPDDQILVGDVFAKYAPHLLVEITGDVLPPTPVVPSTTASETTAPEGVSSEDAVALAPPKRKPGRPRKVPQPVEEIQEEEQNDPEDDI